ncbi:MAG TPA: cobalamin-dependent protein [Bacilli bacterium]|nr:cobalamin-dependent protein [Bacilli bacterium]
MYNIKSVAKMLEMPAVTIRAWERRYNVVSPGRSESGHRLYTEQDIEDLRWLKVQTEEKGVSISQAVKMLEIRRGQQRELVPEVNPKTEQRYEGMSRNLYAALVALDSEKANSLLDLGFSMFHYEEMFHEVLAPLLHRIGEAWERGEIGVGQEHFASHLISQRFYQFFRVFPVQAGLPKVLALCPEGEHHQIGLMLFSLFLRRCGAEVVFLGANTPYEGLLEIVRRNRIRVVAVSALDPQLVPWVERLVAELHQQEPQVQVVLGGGAFVGAAASLQAHVLPGGLADWKQWLVRVML